MDLNKEQIRAFDEASVNFEGRIIGVNYDTNEITVESEAIEREICDSITVPASVVTKSKKNGAETTSQTIICNERSLNAWKLTWIDWREKRMYFSKDPDTAWGEGWAEPGWTHYSEKPSTTVNTGYVRACFDAFDVKSTYDFIVPINDEISMRKFLNMHLSSNSTYSMAGFTHGGGVLYFAQGLSDVWREVALNGGIFTIIDRDKVLEDMNGNN